MLSKEQKGRNPILPLDLHIPDGEAHVMPDGKLYIYGSMDLLEDEYCSDQYQVVSTADMVEWEIHPVSIRSRDIVWRENIDIGSYPDFYQEPMTPLLSSILEGGYVPADPYAESEKLGEEKPPTQEGKLLYAPDAIYYNGLYYLYFCMSDSSEGVAISKWPQGPFTDAIKLPCRGIDPAIFIDDDGQAYYYWGQFYGHAVKLNKDMVSFEQKDVKNWVLTEAEHYFHEGSSMRKIGDTYYAVYANMERGRPTSIGYSTSKSPLGPFEYKGIIVDNAKCDPESWNNHGSIECFNGQWYVFYHRSSRRGRQHRRLCIEPIEVLEDGTIPEVLMTSQGPGKPFALGESIMGYQACELEGAVYIGVHEKYKEALIGMRQGDAARFRYVESERAFTKIQIECEGSGQIEVLLDQSTVGVYEIIEGIQQESIFVAEPGRYQLTLQCVYGSEICINRVELN